MSINLSCPKCGQLLGPNENSCPSCGIDLALAVILAEQALTSIELVPSGAPISPEILVPRLGDYLLERGVLSQEGLQRALEYQKERAGVGYPRLLGETLLELGLVDREVLDQVITEQILQLQAALQQSNRQLEQRVKERTLDLQNALNKLTELNQLKSSFISSISHELRTPLTHMKGYLDLLSNGELGPLTDSQEEALEVMHRAEARLEQLIEDLIRFSLAAKGELSLTLSPRNIYELVAKALSRAAKMAEAKNIELYSNLAENMPSVLVDDDKISWVLLQLLDNAIKFTPPGGKAGIEAFAEGSIVTLKVSDTGIGIPKNRINELFEPFHQLDGSDARRYGGTGLGLALVQKIIDTHGSSIKVRSVEGEGTSFEFYLPVENGYYV